MPKALKSCPKSKISPNLVTLIGYKVKAFSNSSKRKGQTYARVKATASSSLFERWKETGDVRSAFSRNREALAIKCGWKNKISSSESCFISLLHFRPWFTPLIYLIVWLSIEYLISKLVLWKVKRQKKVIFVKKFCARF